MASNGAEPIGSLGYDGPLAALSPERQNLADYFKETVAVVTNPAIDREREIEHFSTRAVFGAPPVAPRPGHRHRARSRPSFPVLLGGHHDLAPLADATYRRIAREHQTYLLEDLWEEFRGRAAAIDTALLESETTHGRDRAASSRRPCKRGARRRRARRAHRPHRLRRRAPLPRPAPRDLRDRPGAEALPRRAGRARTCAAAARSCCARRRSATSTTSSSRSASGANGVNPYVMLEVVCVDDYDAGRRQRLRGALEGDREGDLDDRHPRGPRLRAPVLVDRPASPSSPRSSRPRRSPPPPTAGVGFAALDADTDERLAVLRGDRGRRSRRRRSASTRRSTRRRSPRPTAPPRYEDYSEKVRELEAQSPISMRHIIGSAVRSRADRTERRWTPGWATTTTRS